MRPEEATKPMGVPGELRLDMSLERSTVVPFSMNVRTVGIFQRYLGSIVASSCGPLPVYDDIQR